MPRRRARVRIVILAAVAAPFALACGAKTGLDVPDVFVDAVDAAAPDVPPDAPMPPPLCVANPADAGPRVIADLQIDPQISVADVLFMVDRTGSMTDEIANIRDGLRTIIVPGLLRSIPDLHLGLVTFADFPIYPYGEPSDIPFTLERPLSSDFNALQGAIANIAAMGGGDNPESHVEALWEVATGDGLTPYIAASGGCSSVGVGYPCFRPRAEPVIVMVTDAPFHNGPMDGGVSSNAYDPTQFMPYPAPHTYEQMLSTLTSRLNPRFIGINSGGLGPDTGRNDLIHLARDTGTIGSNGQELVYDINPDGSGLSENVVSAIQRFTSEVPFDVSARAIDIGVPGAANLVSGIIPEGATPMDHVARMDTTSFYAVVPGTHLTFGVQIDPRRAVPMAQEQRFPVRIQFLGDGRPTLGYRDVTIVIPAMGMDCPDQ